MSAPEHWSGLRHNRWLDALIIMLVIIAALYLGQVALGLIQHFVQVLLLFFFAWLIAFFLTPLRSVLESLRFPQLLAATSLYLMVGASLFALGLLLVPRVVADGNAIVQQAPAYSKEAESWITWGHDMLKSVGITDDSLVQYSQNAITRLQTLTTSVPGNLLTAATGFASIVVNVFIVLVLSFYMLMDGDRIVTRVVGLTPPRLRSTIVLFFESVAQSFGAFARAQFILAALAGVITFVVMMLFHIGYASAAAILAGVGMLIPFFGPFFALIPPLAIAAFSVESVGDWVKIAVILWVVQQGLVNVLVPRLLGSVVGMHPLLVLFALLAGGSVAGLWGALFGVPVTAVAFMMLREFYHQVLRGSRIYAERSDSVGTVDFVASAVERPPERSPDVRPGGSTLRPPVGLGDVDSAGVLGGR